MKESQVTEIFRAKVSGEDSPYAPLRVEGFRDEIPQPIRNDGSRNVEVAVNFVWRDRRVKAVIETQGQATPRRVSRTLVNIEKWDAVSDLAAEPVVLVPYLSDGIVEQLERAEVSGIDLNGNYLILTPELLAIRLDQPNDYPQSRGIKKIYSYNSSIVGRFLLQEHRNYEQVNEIHRGIRECGGGVSLSTVSKVLTGMDEDLIISKKRGEIRLLQPEKLLKRLREDYREPRVDRTQKLKLPEDNRAGVLEEALGAKWVWSGESSAIEYAATTSRKTWVAYTNSYASMEDLKAFEDNRFYNCVVNYCEDAFVYFDSRVREDKRWASPVESYLALSQLDKRERELAESIRDNVILREFEDV